MPSESPDAVEVWWPTPVWAFAAFAAGAAVAGAAGLAAIPLAIAAIVAGAFGGDPQGVVGVGIAALCALGVGTVACLACATPLIPWRVRVDAGGVTVGRFRRTVRPRTAIRAVHVDGAWGQPLRVSLDDGTEIVQESAHVQAYQDHDPDRIRRRAAEVAAVLGVPLVDRMAPTASFTAERSRIADVRRDVHRSRQARNESAYPRLHGVPPREPPTVWQGDEVSARVPGQRHAVSVGKKRVTDGLVSAATHRIDAVRVQFSEVLWITEGSLLVEVDGRVLTLVRVPIRNDEQAGNLLWLAALIRSTAESARAARAGGEGGEVPESLRQIQGATRVREGG